MADGFYLVDEKHGTDKGGVSEVKDVLYFKLERAGFDGKADKEHVKNYAAHYGNFKAANPDYKLPWGEDKDFAGVKAPEVGEVFSTPVTERPQEATEDKSGVINVPGEKGKENIEEAHKGPEVTPKSIAPESDAKLFRK